MNAKFFTLTAISLLALTACGGGGSDSGVTTTQSTTGGTPVIPPISNKYADTVSGKVIVEHSDDDKGAWEIFDYQISNLGVANNNNKKDLNSFKITTGKTTYIIKIPKQGDNDFEKHNSFVVNDIDMGNDHEVLNVWGTNLSYARYGLVYGDTDRKQDPKAKYDEFYGMFHQGYLTDPASVPTAGTVNYTGEAVVWNGKASKDGATGVSKNATFTANFSTKHFTGDIKNIVDVDRDDKVKIPDVHLSGTISGNKVTGKDANGTEIDAGFYGPNAKEVAGSFVNKNKVFEGAFGAKRTDK